jgi:hypothetical protein
VPHPTAHQSPERSLCAHPPLPQCSCYIDVERNICLAKLMLHGCFFSQWCDAVPQPPPRIDGGGGKGNMFFSLLLPSPPGRNGSYLQIANAHGNKNAVSPVERDTGGPHVTKTARAKLNPKKNHAEATARPGMASRTECEVFRSCTKPYAHRGPRSSVLCDIAQTLPTALYPKALPHPSHDRAPSNSTF